MRFDRVAMAGWCKWKKKKSLAIALPCHHLLLLSWKSALSASDYATFSCSLTLFADVWSFPAVPVRRRCCLLCECWCAWYHSSSTPSLPSSAVSEVDDWMWKLLRCFFFLLLLLPRKSNDVLDSAAPLNARLQSQEKRKLLLWLFRQVYRHAAPHLFIRDSAGWSIVVLRTLHRRDAVIHHNCAPWLWVCVCAVSMHNFVKSARPAVRPIRLCRSRRGRRLAVTVPVWCVLVVSCRIRAV